MNDIRVFSDKIARDPRQLGLKGALDKRPLGAGTKQALPSVHDEPIIVDGGGFHPVIID
jgi:phospholipid/cholesterol/gamma-HCH transport system substrate-binding protein